MRKHPAGPFQTPAPSRAGHPEGDGNGLQKDGVQTLADPGTYSEPPGIWEALCVLDSLTVVKGDLFRREDL
jgi:hypothetical protein